MKLKRIIAYIIDIFSISTISTIIFTLPFFENDYNEYYKVAEESTARIVDVSGGSQEIDEDVLLEATYDLTRSAQPLNIINIGCTIIYFGVISYLWQGQTIGKKILHIKIVPIKGKNLSPNLFMLRQIIVTNIIPKIASVIAISILSETNWYITNEIIGTISNTITFLLIGFMIYREDERGLHDIIGQTKVISTK